MSMLARLSCVSVLMTRHYTLTVMVTYWIRVLVVMARNVHGFRRSDCKRTFHMYLWMRSFSKARHCKNHASRRSIYTTVTPTLSTRPSEARTISLEKPGMVPTVMLK